MTTMIVGSLQPAYLPWLGFFEQIYQADIFIIYDDMFYNHYSWRNRNNIKTRCGKHLLTVPIKHKQKQLLNETAIDNIIKWNWRRKHWGSIQHAYGKAPYFKDHAPFFEEVYSTKWDMLVDLDVKIIRYICRQIGLTTPIYLSSELGIEREFLKYNKHKDVKNARILFMTKFLKGNVFYEGWAGKSYVDLDYMKRNGVRIEFQNYQHQEYKQLFGPFIPYLSVIDLLFNCGSKSLEILTAHSPTPAKLLRAGEKKTIEELLPVPSSSI